MAQVSTRLYSQFVSQKVRRIRWLPNPENEVSPPPPRRFLTGSWDDGQSNSVSLWDVLFADDQDHRKSSNIRKFQRVCQRKMDGDVTDLKLFGLFGDEKILVGSGRGGMSLLKEAEDGKSLGLVAVWNDLHKLGDLPCSLTGISLFGSDAVTCGEDGGLCRVDMEAWSQAVKMETTSGGMHSIQHLTKDQVIVGCTISRIQMWDLRSKEGPVLKASLSIGKEAANAVTSLATHPGQGHHLTAGTERGALGFYDLRSPARPASSLLDAHSGSVWETMFHPVYPDNLFTCSDDGSVVHWDASDLRRGVFKRKEEEGPLNPWTLGPALAEKVHLTNLDPEQILPINSLDVWGNSVIWGTDSESVSMITDLVLK